MLGSGDERSMTEYEFNAPKFPDLENETELTDWEVFRNHREIVSSFIIRSLSPDAETLCVLGAGKCNDLELPQLAREFSKITLVDILDRDIDIGLRQQQQSNSEIFETITNCDVTGIHQLLSNFKKESSDKKLEEINETLINFNPPIGKYDCVTSTCLLSQLLCHATECIGEDHPEFIDFLQLVRRRHIEIMLNAINDHGVGILVTDFVSSLSLPELLTTNNLQETLQLAIHEKNFLHGLNPAMVAKVFDHANMRPHLKGIRITDPWRWALPDRMYACFAIIFQKN